MNTAAAAMVRVDFYGDSLLAQEREGTIYVALSPMCEALGIVTQAQVIKLKNKHWSGINEKKVKASARPKLIKYQLECALVARALSVTTARIHGYLRRVFCLPGIYLMPAQPFTESMRLLREIDIQRLLLLPTRGIAMRELTAKNAKQMNLFGVN